MIKRNQPGGNYSMEKLTPERPTTQFDESLPYVYRTKDNFSKKSIKIGVRYDKPMNRANFGGSRSST